MHHYPCTGLWLGFDKGSRTTCCIVWYYLWSISTSNASAVNWTASTTYRIHAFTFREMWHYKTLRMAGRLMKQKHFVTTIRGRNWPFCIKITAVYSGRSAYGSAWFATGIMFYVVMRVFRWIYAGNGLVRSVFARGNGIRIKTKLLLLFSYFGCVLRNTRTHTQPPLGFNGQRKCGTLSRRPLSWR